MTYFHENKIFMIQELQIIGFNCPGSGNETCPACSESKGPREKIK